MKKEEKEEVKKWLKLNEVEVAIVPKSGAKAIFRLYAKLNGLKYNSQEFANVYREYKEEAV